MKLRVVPILPAPAALKARTVKRDMRKFIFGKFDFPTEKHPLAFRSDAHFVQRPPSLQGITRLEKAQLPSVCLRQIGGHCLAYGETAQRKAAKPTGGTMAYTNQWVFFSGA